VFTTNNSGATWSNLTLPSGEGVGPISCPTTTVCDALATNSQGIVIATTDGGATWTSESLPAPSSPDAIACPSVTTCYAVVTDSPETAFFPSIDATTDGGATWTSQSVPGSGWLQAISCPTVSTCFAVGVANLFGGALTGAFTTTDGGSTWTPQSVPSGTGLSGVLALGGISCPSAAQCFAVGSNLGGLPPERTMGSSPGAIIVSATVDTTPPTTSVLIPSDGATISGAKALLDATASSAVGIATVSYEVSGGTLSDQVVGSGFPTLYGWLAQWDTTAVPNGTYTLQTVATDRGGLQTTSAPITVTVDNAPPTTSVLTPSNGATESGTAALLDAGASANTKSVSFELTGGPDNDTVIATGFPTIYGWLAEWNTTSVPNGTYTLQSVAAYAGGVTGTSTGITITVSN
jgi:hypothetical protein